MSASTPKDLIIKYNQGSLTAAEEVLLEQYIEQGLIDIDDLEDLRQINQGLDIVMNQAPEIRMHEQFKAMLEEEKDKSQNMAFQLSGWWNQLFGQSLGMRWAYSLALVVLGFGAAWFYNGNQSEPNSPEISAITNEFNELKEMLMLTMLEKESVSDRLQAVSLTNDMENIDGKVTEALFKTLNNDRNVNVRLQCLEALYPYASSPKVRQGLILSIQHQSDPLVQMAPAELMVSLQEKRSVEPLKELLNQEELIEEAREKIEQSVEVLL